MHDLRRQALESKKTVSRKARSRASSQQTSRASSAHNSPRASRNASRQPSDDEDNENESQSDSTAWSTASLDDLVVNEDDPSENGSPASLEDVIKDLTDRKRSSILSRETSLMSYVRILTSSYIDEGLEGQLSDLLSIFAKSIKSESSERETILALKAVALTAVTLPDENSIYDSMVSLLRRTVSDSPALAVKTAAIHCLGTCTFFCGAGDDAAILDQMTFLLEIVSSDGHYVDAPDDADTVAAALEEWGFLATEIEDLEHESEDAVDTFAEQLESSESTVQIAAGENIALLYEKSYTPQEMGEEGDEEDEHHSAGVDSSTPSDDGEDEKGERLIKRYNAYHNTPRIIHQIDSLAHISGRHINKREKKTLHTNFASILTTVENPRRGPYYNKAIDADTQRSYGSRKTVKFQQNSFMRVDRWWKSIRLAALRRLLRGGFVAHYFEGNRAVLDCLPIMMRSFEDQMSSPGSRKEKGGKKGGRRKGIEGF